MNFYIQIKPKLRIFAKVQFENRIIRIISNRSEKKRRKSYLYENNFPDKVVEFTEAKKADEDTIEEEEEVEAKVHEIGTKSKQENNSKSIC